MEKINGTQNVSTVVTREFSDWSVVPLSTAPPAVWLELVREACFPPGTKAQIGVMAAAPEGQGFPVRFDGFSVTAAGP